MSDLVESKGGQAELDATAVDMERFRDFVAIQDVPPQKTLFLHVTGQILVGNPGIIVELDYAEPQGINPNILLLRANFIQRPGIWLQVMTWKSTWYRSGMIQYGQYDQVQIDAGTLSHTVDVIDRA